MTLAAMRRDVAHTSILTPDLCVIGGGLAGSALALAAAAIGLSCVVVDKQARLGRSQAGDLAIDMLLAAAERTGRHAGTRRFADDAAAFVDTRAWIGQAVRRAAVGASADRLRALGVTVLEARASFADKATVLAGSTIIRARRFVIATGARPVSPKIPGLDIVHPMTTDSVAGLSDLPERLVVTGSDRLAFELAQAFRRLGSEVTLLGSPQVIADGDPELLAFVTAALKRDGVIIPPFEIDRLEPRGAGVDVILGDPQRSVVRASHLLIAAGRRPFTESLALDRAGIRCFEGKPVLGADLRTSNRRVFAIGDVTGTAIPAATLVPVQVNLVLRAAFLRQPVRFDPARMPRVIRTRPAFAAVGLTEEEARAAHRKVRIHRWPMAENERAIALEQPHGLVKIVTTPRGRLLGAGIVAAQADELIAPWSLAIAHGLPVDALATLPMPQPSLGDAGRRAALTFVAARLRRPWVKRALGAMRLLG